MEFFTGVHKSSKFAFPTHIQCGHTWLSVFFFNIIQRILLHLKLYNDHHNQNFGHSSLTSSLKRGGMFGGKGLVFFRQNAFALSSHVILLHLLDPEFINL